MQHPQPSQSEIVSHITGIENVHCVLTDPEQTREFYAELFGPPSHMDGDWSEFKISGFDFAVTRGENARFVITFKVKELGELRELLEEKLSTRLPIQHGDYGDYVEVCPEQGFCLHFFEAKERAGSGARGTMSLTK